jgi:hypothetical protein
VREEPRRMTRVECAKQCGYVLQQISISDLV